MEGCTLSTNHARRLAATMASSLVLLLFAASCSAPGPTAKDERAGAPTPTAAAPQALPAPPPPPPLLAHDQAVLTAANTLFSKANLADVERQAGGKYVVVVDPLVDGVSRMQTKATRDMETKIAQLAKTTYPQFEIRPFSASLMARSPLLVVGTFTPINQQGKTEGAREMYRFCLAMVDLKSGKVVSKTVARSRMENVDHTPQPFFRDAPAWTRDSAGEGYVKTCQASKAGDAINPDYIQSLVAAAVVDEGVRAYNAGKYKDALTMFTKAKETTAGTQLRVLSGIYLSNWKLGRQAETAKSFGDVVAYGLDQGQLAVTFVFNQGATTLPPGTKSAPNDIWLKTIAQSLSDKSQCAEVGGHASRSGPEVVNERLSSLRAEYVRRRLVSEAPSLGNRLIATGYGSRETLVGTGTDDAQDMLDRRVEFKVLKCSG
jgi:outer membrane protein OmpA-like peptidoglycan-associated protein